MTATQPTPDQIAQFASGDMDEQICMVNLLKFRETAEYAPDAPEAAETLTGLEAYMRYGAGVAQVLEKIGAKQHFAGPVSQFVIGDGDWDMVALVIYPSRRAFIEMPQREDYQAIHYHREAGLARQDLIATLPGMV